MLYSGDTYTTEEIWAVAAREPTLKAAFVEKPRFPIAWRIRPWPASI